MINVDAVIIAERPRLLPYIDEMIANISSVLDIAPGLVSVKSTTTEGLGVCGQGKAIAAQAAVLISKN